MHLAGPAAARQAGPAASAPRATAAAAPQHAPVRSPMHRSPTASPQRAHQGRHPIAPAFELLESSCVNDYRANSEGPAINLSIGSVAAQSLLQQLAKGDLVVGHRGGPRVRVASRNPTLPSTAAVATAVGKSLAYAKLSTVASASDLPTAPTSLPGARPVSRHRRGGHRAAAALELKLQGIFVGHAAQRRCANLSSQSV